MQSVRVLLDSEYKDIFTALVISLLARSTVFRLCKPSMTILDNSMLAIMSNVHFSKADLLCGLIFSLTHRFG